MSGHTFRWLTAAASLAFAGSAQGAPLPQGSEYVALGSSFAAGPGIAEPAPDSPGRCGQSNENYPRQIARALRLRLVDRSCGGATTDDVLASGPNRRPPQLDGLTPDTRLVTVTVGGNDVRYMADFGLAVCRERAKALADGELATTCPAPADFSLDRAFAATEANLRAIAAEVHRRSPRARLMFVDYVSVLPPTGSCAVLGISSASADALRARAARLAELTARVAHNTGAELVEASRLTLGHDACASVPLTAGLSSRPFGSWGTASFHPLLPAMTAIANAVVRRIKD